MSEGMYGCSLSPKCFSCRIVLLDVKDDVGASLGVQDVVLFHDASLPLLLNQAVLRSRLPMVSSDAIRNLLTSSGLLRCTSDHMSFASEFLCFLVFAHLRLNLGVLRLTMTFKLLGRGFVDLEGINETKLDALRDTSPCSFGVLFADGSIDVVFVRSDQAIHVVVQRREEILPAGRLF